MPTEIKLPSLGDGIDSADVLEIFVSEGDSIKKDQGLMELETDKATVTVPSPHAGKLVSFQIKEGDSVSVGQVFATIETGSKEAPKSEKAEEPKSADPPAAKDEAKASEPETSEAEQDEPKQKPASEAPKPTPKQQTKQSPPPAPQSSGSRDAPIPNTSKPAIANSESNGSTTSDESIPAGPAIRRFAREVGVDLATVKGSGDYGRILREDVLNVVKRLGQAQPSSRQSESEEQTALTEKAPAADKPATSSSKSPAKDLPGTAAEDDYGPIRVEKMAKIRKTIAKQMHKSWSTVPRVCNFDDADITDLEAFRQQSKEDYAARGVKLTTMPFLIRAVATALKDHPSMNATIDMDNDQIIYKDYVNLGIAVDTPRGLVVPTLKSADKMSIPDIAHQLGELSGKVRDSKFSESDLRGGTFTISNLGAIGGTYSTPIVNVPEVAILLVGRSRKMPMVLKNDKIEARLMMPLSLAYDHRLVDGGTAARFLNEVIGYLEAPSRLLLAI